MNEKELHAARIEMEIADLWMKVTGQSFVDVKSDPLNLLYDIRRQITILQHAVRS